MLEQHHEGEEEEDGESEEKAFKYRGDHSLVSPYSAGCCLICRLNLY